MQVFEQGHSTTGGVPESHLWQILFVLHALVQGLANYSLTGPIWPTVCVHKVLSEQTCSSTCLWLFLQPKGRAVIDHMASKPNYLLSVLLHKVCGTLPQMRGQPIRAWLGPGHTRGRGFLGHLEALRTRISGLAGTSGGKGETGSLVLDSFSLTCTKALA